MLAQLRAGIGLCRGVLGCVIAVGGATPAVWAQGITSEIGCVLPVIGSGTVKSVADGRTIILADGRVLRLSAIDVADLEGPNPAAGALAKADLEGLIAGRDLILKRLGADTDRYGRLLAQAYIRAGTTERWLQAELIGLGRARVAARVGEKACSDVLLARERAARSSKLGLWADPYYVISRAEDPASVLAQRGQFGLVEGKVVSVRESGGTIYVNFGRRWSEDFTVTIAKRNERLFAETGLELKKLGGHRIRVRGTIEERGGPWIDATRPEQIELADGTR